MIVNAVMTGAVRVANEGSIVVDDDNVDNRRRIICGSFRIKWTGL